MTGYWEGYFFGFITASFIIVFTFIVTRKGDV